MPSEFTDRKLSTRDKNFFSDLQLSPDEQAYQEVQEILSSPADLGYIDKELRTQRNPVIRAVLEEERNSVLRKYQRGMDIQSNAAQQKKSPSIMEIIGDSLKNIWSVPR